MHEAILLIGPTGSGKTPLGDLLEERGLRGRPCVHFDFGRELRRVAQPGQSDPSDRSDSSAHRRHAGARHQGLLALDETDFVRHVLRTGSLLEDEHFPIARKILTAFLSRHVCLTAANASKQGPSSSASSGISPAPAAPASSAAPATPASSAASRKAPSPIIILNGLPRHVGQAADVDRLLHVAAVVHLICTAETALERIHANAGGDRTARIDDDIDAVRAKFALFDRRTKPLLDHYRRRPGAATIPIEVDPTTTAEQIWDRLQQPPPILPDQDRPAASRRT